MKYVCTPDQSCRMIDPVTLSSVRALIAPDLTGATDDADLADRLARNGYGFRDTRRGRKLVTLPHGVELMDLPVRPGLR